MHEAKEAAEDVNMQWPERHGGLVGICSYSANWPSCCHAIVAHCLSSFLAT